MSRPQLITERLAAALNAAGRFDLLSDEEIVRIVHETLPGVPTYLQDEALKFVADAWWKNTREQALGFLATWQPEGRPN